jgi:hypothetical protein
MMKAHWFWLQLTIYGILGARCMASSFATRLAKEWTRIIGGKYFISAVPSLFGRSVSNMTFRLPKD